MGKYKCDLRREFLNKRIELVADEVILKSQKIFSKIIDLDEYKISKVLHTYVSSKDNEVLTDQLIRYSLRKRKRVIVPIVDGVKRMLLHSELHSLKELKRSTFDILEPSRKYWRLVNIDTVDLIIVPGIVFDLKCNRIGYGGGYYDKLLATIGCLKVGLAYDFQIVEELFPSATDQSLDIIITEKRILEKG